MKTKEVIKKAQERARPYCVADGAKFRLKDCDPGDTMGLQSEDKPRAKEALQNGINALTTLQDMLYAQDRKTELEKVIAKEFQFRPGRAGWIVPGCGCEAGFRFQQSRPELYRSM